ncbi:MAG: chromosome condensation regulator RCC1, partial [Bifidobacterium sp.]|nr:chromosome condensation regulator RCC1 [Bifidobacterium sp.]
GYLFDGWFIGDTPVAYDFNQPVTDNLTLTAKWTKGAGTWSISPDHGPETGNTKITITPPAAQGLRFGQISAGNSHSLAIGSDGNLYSWGSNQYGQLGRSIGSATKDAQPGLVTKPAGTTGSFTWSQASAGGRSSMAIGSNGILYSWGYNQLGQLGNGSRDSQTHIKPGPIKNPSTATGPWSRVSAGYDHALAIGSDGKIYSWGSNNHG